MDVATPVTLYRNPVSGVIHPNGLAGRIIREWDGQTYRVFVDALDCDVDVEALVVAPNCYATFARLQLQTVEQLILFAKHFSPERTVLEDLPGGDANAQQHMPLVLTAGTPVRFEMDGRQVLRLFRGNELVAQLLPMIHLSCPAVEIELDEAGRLETTYDTNMLDATMFVVCCRGKPESLFYAARQPRWLLGVDHLNALLDPQVLPFVVINMADTIKMAIQPTKAAHIFYHAREGYLQFVDEHGSSNRIISMQWSARQLRLARLDWTTCTRVALLHTLRHEPKPRWITLRVFPRGVEVIYENKPTRVQSVLDDGLVVLSEEQRVDADHLMYHPEGFLATQILLAVHAVNYAGMKKCDAIEELVELSNVLLQELKRKEHARHLVILKMNLPDDEMCILPVEAMEAIVGTAASLLCLRATIEGLIRMLRLFRGPKAPVLCVEREVLVAVNESGDEAHVGNLGVDLQWMQWHLIQRDDKIESMPKAYDKLIAFMRSNAPISKTISSCVATATTTRSKVDRPKKQPQPSADEIERADRAMRALVEEEEKEVAQRKRKKANRRRKKSSPTHIAATLEDLVQHPAQSAEGIAADDAAEGIAEYAAEGIADDAAEGIAEYAAEGIADDAADDAPPVDVEGALKNVEKDMVPKEGARVGQGAAKQASVEEEDAALDDGAASDAMEEEGAEAVEEIGKVVVVEEAVVQPSETKMADDWLEEAGFQTVGNRTTKAVQRKLTSQVNELAQQLADERRCAEEKARRAQALLTEEQEAARLERAACAAEMAAEREKNEAAKAELTAELEAAKAELTAELQAAKAQSAEAQAKLAAANSELVAELAAARGELEAYAAANTQLKVERASEVARTRAGMLQKLDEQVRFYLSLPNMRISETTVNLDMAFHGVASKKIIECLQLVDESLDATERVIDAYIASVPHKFDRATRHLTIAA